MMKKLIIYWLWIDYISFQLQLKILTHVIKFKKLDKFSIQMNRSVLKEKKLLRNYFHLRKKRIMLKFFISKSILYIYQNVKWKKKLLGKNNT